MKHPLPLILLCLLSSGVIAQQPILSAQIGSNTTRSIDGALMYGIKTDQAQFLIGIEGKQILSDIAHKRTYAGLRFHGQKQLFGKVAPFISFGALRGEYLMYENGEAEIATVKKTIHLHGTLGAGIMFIGNAGLFIGYSFQEYNPAKYYRSQQNPHLDGVLTLKLSFNFEL